MPFRTRSTDLLTRSVLEYACCMRNTNGLEYSSRRFYADQKTWPGGGSFEESLPFLSSERHQRGSPLVIIASFSGHVASWGWG